ncbi:uncharacterized protein LOC123558712 [Mercenaria mercenaria]|uniref:uncharacterized protein LOC123558712 n=1 Tax=Mercenaria mercenaria TaxID=6596 RepID=UPI00234EFC7A|nr:uncharacterized protein LOC123558712 [Mercenaria mercenaria]
MSTSSLDYNVTSTSEERLVKTRLQNGYDIPLYGIGNGSFYYIHIPAILCICTSFVCAVISIILSFKRKSYHTFFTNTWSRSERFIVYLAICDGLFNVSHFTDHMHIVIVRDHVYPKELCEYYGFNLAVFVTSQNLMVNVVAINAFMLMYFNRHLNFGRRDWKLLLWTFGTPFIGATIAGITGQLGTNGSFCYFDGVKGKVANICFTTIPLLLIVIVNTILYILTWKRIRDETETFEKSVHDMSASMRASHRAARAMSLFVAAFFIQWWAMALYGVWGLVDENVPQPIFHFVTTFSNIGGCLNLGVYLLIHRQQLGKGENISTEKHTLESDGHKISHAVSKSANVSSCDVSVSENHVTGKYHAERITDV